MDELIKIIKARAEEFHNQYPEVPLSEITDWFCKLATDAYDYGEAQGYRSGYNEGVDSIEGL